MSDTEKPAAAPAVDKKAPVSSAEADLTKYKTAADIVHNVMKKLIELSVEGAKIIDLCIEGDKLIEAGTAGVYNKSVQGPRLPTSISVNTTVAHFSPLASSQVLAKDDMSPVTGRRADVLKAAWHAAEIAMRTNWAVTDVVGKSRVRWPAYSPRSLLTLCDRDACLLPADANVIDGKKRIILNPSEAQKRDFEGATFAEGEVYGYLDCPGLARREEATKAGAFPFNIRSSRTRSGSRMGIQEAVQHGLVKPYEVIYTPSNTFVAAFHLRSRYCPAARRSSHTPDLTEKELEDEELKALLVRNLRENKKSKKKKAKTEAADAADAADEE
ncbi:hypothetical protein DFH09DRAFT_1192170 [Mycena vulgaris]|nr:hypothetical protein DFH09DRAFT_1192170 [Mycena vulgaris]